MSRRHQDDKPVRATRADRKKAVRTVRHQVAQKLHTVADPDDVTLAEPRVDHAHRPPTRRRSLRHWKLKAWKRRTAVRRQRNQRSAELALDEG